MASRTTRLLVDLNRSTHHRGVFSEITRGCDARTRQQLLEQYYEPYRAVVESGIARASRRGKTVLHLSAHSFTPRLDGTTRNADVGLLFDPARPLERAYCLKLQSRLREALPGLVIRRNYPYRGTADGLTTHLRRRFGARSYAGVEIEVNQKYPLGDARRWRALRAALVDCVHVSVDDLNHQ